LKEVGLIDGQGSWWLTRKLFSTLCFSWFSLS